MAGQSRAYIAWEKFSENVRTSARARRKCRKCDAASSETNKIGLRAVGFVIIIGLQHKCDAHASKMLR